MQNKNQSKTFHVKMSVSGMENKARTSPLFFVGKVGNQKYDKREEEWQRRRMRRARKQKDSENESWGGIGMII